jgi:hypothetical protein
MIGAKIVTAGKIWGVNLRRGGLEGQAVNGRRVGVEVGLMRMWMLIGVEDKGSCSWGEEIGQK